MPDSSPGPGRYFGAGIVGRPASRQAANPRRRRLRSRTPGRQALRPRAPRRSRGHRAARPVLETADMRVPPGALRRESPLETVRGPMKRARHDPVAVAVEIRADVDDDRPFLDCGEGFGGLDPRDPILSGSKKLFRCPSLGRHWHDQIIRRDAAPVENGRARCAERLLTLASVPSRSCRGRRTSAPCGECLRTQSARTCRQAGRFRFARSRAVRGAWRTLPPAAPRQFTPSRGRFCDGPLR